MNAELINLYWNIGEYICRKIEQSEWGDAVVAELANFIQTHEPEIKGFSDKNIWRMKQFYETYEKFPELSPLVREISWTNNLLIFSRCKTLKHWIETLKKPMKIRVLAFYSARIKIVKS